MPKFKIAVEITGSKILAKTIEAENLDEAKRLAEREAWTEDYGWEEIDANIGPNEIRDDLCEEVTDE